MYLSASHMHFHCYKHPIRSGREQFCYVTVTLNIQVVDKHFVPVEEDDGRHWKIEIGDIA